MSDTTCPCLKDSTPAQALTVPAVPVDLDTPLYEACGGRLYRLHIQTRAKAIMMSDGVSVEDRINTVERAQAANTTIRFADTISARNSLAGVVPGDQCYVFDARPDVKSGGAMYMWMPGKSWQLVWTGKSPIDVVNLILANGGLKVDPTSEKLVVDCARLIHDDGGLDLCENGRIKIDTAQIVASKGGLKVDRDGRLYLDISTLSEEDRSAFLGNLIHAGGGLAVDANDGKLIVTLSSMSTADLKKLLASMIHAGGGLAVDPNDGKLIVTLSSMSTADLKKLLASMIHAGGGVTVDPDDGKLVLSLDSMSAADLKKLLTSMIHTGGGLAVNPDDGKLMVNFNSMDPNIMKGIVLSMVQSGGGLVVDNTGKIYFDPDSMDTAVFDRMLKALHLPKWLTSNTTFYVDKNHAQAADTLVEGRGLSASKPFKTIQACVNYVCENYNLGSHNAYIRIAGGTYNERLVLGNYSSTTGFIRIMPASDDDEVIIRNTGSGRQNAQNCALNGSAGNWSVENIKIVYAPEAFTQNDYNAFAIYATDGISISGCHLHVDLSETDAGGNAMTAYMIGVSGAGAGVNITPGPKKTIFEFTPHATATNSLTVLTAVNSGAINGDVSRETGHTGLVECRFNTMGLFMHATGNASVTFRQMSGLAVPNISFQAGPGYTITGKRYAIDKGATCNVYGMGANYFPGTTEGTVEADTYSWYK